jgi:methionyl aminopeptidase
MLRKYAAVKLKSPREIGLMREAGKVVAEALAIAGDLAKPGNTTRMIDSAIAELFRKHEAEPLFLGVPNPTPGKRAFPAVVCSSLNEAVVHGIPNDAPLREGDIISIDTGCRLNGWCGDAAVTFAIGEVKPEVRQLLDVTRGVLDLAIARMATATAWSEVAHDMEVYVRRSGMSVIEKFVGHGIGRGMHEEPQVPNFVSDSLKKQDIRLEPGIVLAIEPMVALGKKEVRVLKDDWTVQTADRRPAAHFEHTVALTPDGPLILTLPADPTAP